MSATYPASEKIKKCLSSLSYDPVLDSDSAVKSWVASHNNGTFYPFINGEYLKPSDDQIKSVFSVTNPFNGSQLANVVNCDEKLVNLAIDAGKNASANWKSLTTIERGRIIYNIARNIQKNPALLIACESVNGGRSSREVKDLDIANIIKTFYYYAGSVGSSNYDDYSPLGTVAICGHHDSSLLSIAGKLASALATGNSTILIPSKLTPLSAFLLVEVCVQSGVPSGVVNLIASESENIYGLIAASSSVNCITFDGKSKAGQELPISSSFVNPSTRTLLSLEGKSSLVIYESADIDSAVESVCDGCFYSNGQHRYSLNKVLVQECIYTDVLQRLETRFAKVKTGNHMDKCNDLGSIRNAAELKMQLAKEAETNGAKITEFRSNEAANLISPKIIQNATLNSSFNLAEIDGPYVQLIKFRTVKESIDLLNNSKYGSCVSLFSQNISLVMEAAYLLNVGTVWMNSFPIERGVQVRKASGNYSLTGTKSLLNFLRPTNDDFKPSSVTSLASAKEKLGKYGSLASTVPAIQELSVERTYKMYVGGKQTRPDTSNSKAVYAANESKVHALVPDASRKDVRNAVEAANNSFKSWSKRANHNKAQILYYFEENFTARSAQLVDNLELLTKKSRSQCEKEVKLCADTIFYFASFCDKYIGHLKDSTEYGYLMEIKEALGVVAIICGHDSSNPTPLLSFILYMTAAIAHGNTVIIVPDEKFPTLALDVCQIFETSDLPDGVVNIITGSKHHLAKHLCEHQQLNAIWYMNDVTKNEIENRIISEVDLEAQQFLKYTASFSGKKTWFINSPAECDEQGVSKVHLNQMHDLSVQNKYVHIPMGIIFAN